MGKILECGGQCSTPKSHGAVATVYASGLFDVRPMALESVCTPLSVAGRQRVAELGHRRRGRPR